MRIREKIGYKASQRVNNFTDLNISEQERKQLYIVIFNGLPVNLAQDIAKAPQGSTNLFQHCKRWFKQLLRLPVDDNLINLKLGYDLDKDSVQKEDPIDIQTDLEKYIKQTKMYTPSWINTKKAKEITIAIQYEYLKRANQIAKSYIKKTARKNRVPIYTVKLQMKYLPLPKLYRLKKALPTTAKAYGKYKTQMKDFE